MHKWLPSGPEVIRETIVVLAGALVATLIVKSLPASQQGLFNFMGSNSPQ
jgi:preprotein translocase subunit SecE